VRLLAERITRDTSIQRTSHTTWVFDLDSYDAVVGDALHDGLLEQVMVAMTTASYLIPDEGVLSSPGGIKITMKHCKVLSLSR